MRTDLMSIRVSSAAFVETLPDVAEKGEQIRTVVGPVDEDRGASEE